jgi:hypothetical protein
MLFPLNFFYVVFIGDAGGKVSILELVMGFFLHSINRKLQIRQTSLNRGHM